MTMDELEQALAAGACRGRGVTITQAGPTVPEIWRIRIGNHARSWTACIHRDEIDAYLEDLIEATSRELPSRNVTSPRATKILRERGFVGL
jgi:hypothetical protein